MAVVAREPTTRLAEEILDILRRRPEITVQELADELARLDESEVIRSLRAVLDLVLVEADSESAAGPGLQMPASWGPQPSQGELVHAEREGERVRANALSEALAGALTRDEVASRIGISPQAVSERLKSGKLVALRRGREWRFPPWQFSDDGTLPELDKLISYWPGTPLSLSTWAIKPSVDLDGRSPAQELTRRDGARRVLELMDSLTAAAW